MGAKSQDIGLMLRGEKFRRGLKALAVAILGKHAPPVYSRGSQFYNRNRWTSRMVVGEAAKFAKGNPKCIPDKKTVEAWCQKANSERVRPEIVVANVPDILPVRTACALRGGTWHECWHTEFSCLRDLTGSELSKIILPRWAKIPDWSRFHGLIQSWSNIVEDIRIERLGNPKYPGSKVPMHDLQDFILKMEAKGQHEVRSHGKQASTSNALRVITATFRDVGLGYKTELQRAALIGYRQENPEAVKMVLEGPLAPYLRESIALSADDDLGSLRIALDVIITLAELGGFDEDPQGEDEAKDGQPGDGEQKCPGCGADASKIKVRPMPDGRGGKIKGKGLATCTECGWQEEVDVKAEKKKPGKPKKSGSGPQFEGFDPEDFDMGGSGSPGDDDGDEDGQGGSGGGEEGDEDGPGGGGGGDQNGDGDENGDTPGGKDGKDGDEDGDCNKPGDKPGDKPGQFPDKPTGGDESGDAKKPGKGGMAGGHHHHQGPLDGKDWTDIAQDALNNASNGPGLLDNNSALEAAVDGTNSKAEGTVQAGEAHWRPYDLSLDDIMFVKPSKRGISHDQDVAKALLVSVRDESRYVRARLQNIVRALEMTDTIHGVRHGKSLSSRFLVDSKVALQDGQQPKRAYWQREDQLDVSMSAVVVIDESSSMDSWLREATRIMLAIVEPLSALKCPTMACGFRNGRRGSHNRNMWSSVHSTIDGEKGRTYHRYDGIIHDIFKTFDEDFRSVRWRFANTMATGGTPMSDGIEFGLDHLNLRNEGHRFLFIITDGCPNGGHTEIIRKQVRLAKEAGIHVIGVGMGSGAEYVKNLFPDYVYAASVPEIPKKLIQKLNEIVDKFGTKKRGKRIKKTG